MQSSLISSPAAQSPHSLTAQLQVMNFSKNPLAIDQSTFIQDGPSVDPSVSARLLLPVVSIADPDLLPPSDFVVMWTERFVEAWRNFVPFRTAADAVIALKAYELVSGHLEQHGTLEIVRLAQPLFPLRAAKLVAEDKAAADDRRDAVLEKAKGFYFSGVLSPEDFRSIRDTGIVPTACEHLFRTPLLPSSSNLRPSPHPINQHSPSSTFLSLPISRQTSNQTSQHTSPHSSTLSSTLPPLPSPLRSTPFQDLSSDNSTRPPRITLHIGPPPALATNKSPPPNPPPKRRRQESEAAPQSAVAVVQAAPDLDSDSCELCRKANVDCDIRGGIPCARCKQLKKKCTRYQAPLTRSRRSAVSFQDPQVSSADNVKGKSKGKAADRVQPRPLNDNSRSSHNVASGSGTRSDTARTQGPVLGYVGAPRHYRKRSQEDIDGDIWQYRGLRDEMDRLYRQRQGIDAEIRMKQEQLDVLARRLAADGVKTEDIPREPEYRHPNTPEEKPVDDTM